VEADWARECARTHRASRNENRSLELDNVIADHQIDLAVEFLPALLERRGHVLPQLDGLYHLDPA